ncbi:MAG: trimeric intracellular cation channel family protein [Chthoniobacteraceae bacterium]
MTLSLFLDHFGVAVGAITGVLGARGKRVDLFGVLVLALVTAFGGATVRDVLAGDLPVIWLRGPWLLVNVTVTALVTFVLARFHPPPHRLLLIVDALVLGAFAMIGTTKGIALHFSAPVCVLLGVITSVAGGIGRDVLMGEVPMVFRSEIHLYATAALIGSAACVSLELLGVSATAATIAGGALVLTLRLAGIYWKLSLPLFETR